MKSNLKIMAIKVFYLLLVVGMINSCTKDSDHIEPQDPPIEKPEEPIKPGIILDTKYIINIKIENKIMAIVGTSDWCSVTYGNGKYVAVGYEGNIAYSTDGINWTAKIVGGKSAYWYDVTYGNGKFVVVGQNTVLYSTDAINWTTVKNDTYWKGIKYFNGKYIAVGNDGNITYSTDAINWTTKTVGGREGWQSVTYGNGKYVVVGYEGNIAYSTDGINWTAKTLGGREDLKSVIYNNENFIAVGTNGYHITSTDGINWSNFMRVKDENGYSVLFDINGICLVQ